VRPSYRHKLSTLACWNATPTSSSPSSADSSLRWSMGQTQRFSPPIKAQGHRGHCTAGITVEEGKEEEGEGAATDPPLTSPRRTGRRGRPTTSTPTCYRGRGQAAAAPTGRGPQANSHAAPRPPPFPPTTVTRPPPPTTHTTTTTITMRPAAAVTTQRTLKTRPTPHPRPRIASP
jgi:hypothetical protein